MAFAADLLAWVRAIHMFSSALVAGALCYASFVGEPALRNAPGFESAGHDRQRRKHTKLIASGLLLAVASGAAWLALLAARVSDEPAPQALSEAAWTLLTQTRFGTVWQLRFACALVLAGLLAAKRWTGKRPLAFERAALALGVIFVAALAWSGHGGATPGAAGYAHAAADMLHLIAAAAWFGGLIPLAITLQHVHRSPSDPSSELALDVLQRFSNLGIVSVAIIATTGVVNTGFAIACTEALIETAYGRLLLLKITMFLGMLGVAAINRLRLMPMLETDSPAHAAGIRRRIYFNTVAEIALGVVIFVIVGSLGLTEPMAGMPEHNH